MLGTFSLIYLPKSLGKICLHSENEQIEFLLLHLMNAFFVTSKVRVGKNSARISQQIKASEFCKLLKCIFTLQQMNDS